MLRPCSCPEGSHSVVRSVCWLLWKGQGGRISLYLEEEGVVTHSLPGEVTRELSLGVVLPRGKLRKGIPGQMIAKPWGVSGVCSGNARYI